MQLKRVIYFNDGIDVLSRMSTKHVQRVLCPSWAVYLHAKKTVKLQEPIKTISLWQRRPSTAPEQRLVFTTGLIHKQKNVVLSLQEYDSMVLFRSPHYYCNLWHGQLFGHLRRQQGFLSEQDHNFNCPLRSRVWQSWVPTMQKHGLASSVQRHWAKYVVRRFSSSGLPTIKAIKLIIIP